MTIDDGTTEPAQDPGMESGQDTEAVAGSDRDPLGKDVPDGAMGAGEEDAPDLEAGAEGSQPMTS